MRRNNRIRPALAGLALVAGLAMTAAAYAEVAPAPAPVTGDATKVEMRQTAWSSRCSSGGRASALDCAAESRVGAPASGQLVVAFTVRVPSDTRSPVMLVQVPLGVSLPPGVTLAVDGGAATTLPFQTCDASGCYAGAAMAKDLLAAMSKGGTLSVRFQNVNKDEISASLTLTGFAAALDRIK